MKFRERILKKFNRKTGEYDKQISLFDKYQIGEIKKSDKNWITIEVIGPKQKFCLCQCVKPLKVYKPEQAVKELPFFFVMSNFKVTKIQSATHFALENDELIAYRVAGGFAEEV